MEIIQVTSHLIGDEVHVIVYLRWASVYTGNGNRSSLLAIARLIYPRHGAYSFDDLGVSNLITQKLDPGKEFVPCEQGISVSAADDEPITDGIYLTHAHSLYYDPVSQAIETKGIEITPDAQYISMADRPKHAIHGAYHKYIEPIP